MPGKAQQAKAKRSVPAAQEKAPYAATQKVESVNHPAHYQIGGIEVIDVIEAWQLNFHLGQVVKYVARAGRKDAGKLVEDLRKARWYLDRHITQLAKSP